jgi:hypothetical protein
MIPISREKRIKYFGFDDRWFFVIGVLVVSVIIDFLFNNSFSRYSLGEALVSWSIALVFTISNWSVMRWAMLSQRRRLPLFRDNIKRSGILFIIMIGTVLVIDMIGNYALARAFGDDYHPISKPRLLIPILLISTMILAIYEAVYYYLRLKTTIRQEEQAKQLVVQAKMDALRNQAQPHFLFNSLNTLRDIIDYDSKDDAKKFVDKLSDVYRFILDTGNANLVTLHDELKFAKSYIHIQSERFGDNLKMVWDIDEGVLDHMVIPMSLQLLLENAIKHNVISKAKPLEIIVKVDRDQLTVVNKIQPKTTQLPSTKLGLKNIVKRYALISDKIPSFGSDGIHFKVALPLLAKNKKVNV